MSWWHFICNYCIMLHNQYIYINVNWLTRSHGTKWFQTNVKTMQDKKDMPSLIYLIWALCPRWIHITWLSHTKQMHVSIYWSVLCFCLGWTVILDCIDMFLFCAEMQHIFTHISSSFCYPYPSILCDNETPKSCFVAIMNTMHHVDAAIAYLLFKF